MSWRNNLRDVEPYVAGEQPKMSNLIKLNTNENPYEPGEKVKEAIQTFDPFKLRLYPDADASKLKHLIAEYHGLDDKQVFIGNGSDEVLALTFLTCFNGKDPLLFPDITYSFYDVWAELFQIPYERPALDDHFDLIPEDYYKENGGVVIANPNAPTGVLQSLDFLRDVIEHNRDVVVIIDEAYADFSGSSALELTKEYDNVLIVQTYSKSRSLAGMRIGYAMGNPELIRAMNDVRYSYNSYPMTRLSVALGAAALEDEAYFRETVAKVIETREWTKKELKRLGFSFRDSQTNFIFATHEIVPAQTIFDVLREKHIFVRHFGQKRIENYLRISIGTQAEMERFIRETEQIIAQNR